MKVLVPVVPAPGSCRSPASTANTVAGARAAIGRCLADWRLESLTGDVLLVMTEMLSNAVRHGTPPWGVRMWLFRGDEGPWYVRLEVDDAGPGIDIDVVRARWRHPSGFLAEGGRGLLMVDALASSWGDEPSSHGHTMWAQLEAEPGSAKG
ncbi:ATP-binding protein [Streptomyces flavidovirens]|uniref:ATP-binding protein n=1 Tax=Streptomyces flavidovirens TaxID=67298 RepID=UPI00368A9A02